MFRPNNPVTGNASFIDNIAEIDLGASTTYARMLDGTARSWGNYPVGSSDAESFAEISAGDYHGCATKKNHYVWCWGDSTAGQLGPPAPLNVTFSTPRSSPFSATPCSTSRWGASTPVPSRPTTPSSAGERTPQDSSATTARPTVRTWFPSSALRSPAPIPSPDSMPGAITPVCSAPMGPCIAGDPTSTASSGWATRPIDSSPPPFPASEAPCRWPSAATIPARSEQTEPCAAGAPTAQVSSATERPRPD